MSFSFQAGSRFSTPNGNTAQLANQEMGRSVDWFNEKNKQIAWLYINEKKQMVISMQPSFGQTFGLPVEHPDRQTDLSNMLEYSRILLHANPKKNGYEIHQHSANQDDYNFVQEVADYTFNKKKSKVVSVTL